MFQSDIMSLVIGPLEEAKCTRNGKWGSPRHSCSSAVGMIKEKGDGVSSFACRVSQTSINSKERKASVTHLGCKFLLCGNVMSILLKDIVYPLAGHC